MLYDMITMFSSSFLDKCCPKDFMTERKSLTFIIPLPLLSNKLNACLNSFICSKFKVSALLLKFLIKLLNFIKIYFNITIMLLKIYSTQNSSLTLNKLNIINKIKLIIINILLIQYY